MKRYFLTLAWGLGLVWLAMGSLSANNVQISNVSLTGNNLSFDVSWNNSWRVTNTAPYNYDALWIFVKYRDCATNQWGHASIDTAFAASPLRADTTIDQKGVFVYRSSDGVGNIPTTGVTVHLTNMPSGNFDFKVFGIEMVYIPEGSFLLGDGASTNTFRRGPTTATPYTVANENAITVSNSGAFLYAISNITTGTIPAQFPKGYNDFYCMKYEISQTQYAEFLNTLTSTQAANRYLVSTANRYTLSGAWPVISAAAGNRACAFLSWSDLTAYMDWAALRPMSEMEFEKVCRGPAAHVPGEYAWGTTLITDVITVGSDGTPSETATNPVPPGSGIANFNNNVVLGPMRNGFNGSGASNRLTLGASYYGVCELSGNVWERIVHVVNNNGRNFRPNHGDGNLTSTGFSDVANMAPVSGSGLRGGSWTNTAVNLRTSDRTTAVYNNNGRFNNVGGRAVRTAD